MTIANMRPAKAVGEQMVFAAGQFQVPSANTGTANVQIIPSNLTVQSVGTSQLDPTQTVSPIGSRIPIFMNPAGSQAAFSGNQVALPRGMQGSITSATGSEFLLDFSGFSADIISAAANILSNSRGSFPFRLSANCVDNVNKLVYLQGFSSGGSITAMPSGCIIAYQVFLKDTFSV